MFSLFRSWIWRLSVLLAVAMAPAPARAEISDSFESTEKSWSPNGSDCPQRRIEVHERVWGKARSGKRSEHVQLRASGGSPRVRLETTRAPLWSGLAVPETLSTSSDERSASRGQRMLPTTPTPGAVAMPCATRFLESHTA